MAASLAFRDIRFMYFFRKFYAVLPCGQWRCIGAFSSGVFDRIAGEFSDGVDNWPEVAASASCSSGCDRYWRCSHAVLAELKMSDAALQSLVFCLFGTLFFCTGNMVSQNSQQHSIPVFASTAWGMLYGTCYLGMFSLLMDHEFTIEVTARYLGSLVWLTIVSTVLTFSCYLMLIGRIGASRAGYATVAFSVFALLLSTSFEITIGV